LSLKNRLLMIAIITAVALALILPGPFAEKFFKGEPIRLGLDLKGGIEMVLAPDYRIGARPLAKLGEELIAAMAQAKITAPQITQLGVADNERYEGLELTFASAKEVERAKNLGLFQGARKLDFFGETINLILAPVYKGNKIELAINQDSKDFPEDALRNAKEIIENRISGAASGMAEADVRIDNKGRLNVQLPGIKTLEDARKIITATGRLTFRINDRIVLDGTDMEVTGVGPNPQGGGYVIRFSFKGDAAKQLEKITSENINKTMAVYLDEKMLMDPTIKDTIPGGEGMITFGSGASRQDVERDALLMKAGALPISLRVVQSTQVAPTLGKEIVNQSLVAGLIGILLVMAFMLVFYNRPGLIADAVLVIYAIVVMATMAIFRGVLTLPGVAGMILSLGMAVDANIIIFERIKDEIRNGKRVRAAIHAGFDRAYITILDSNLTTLISAGVLFFFGTGAVQGFAVTLTIGVLLSMFTALFVTRAFLDWRTELNPDRYIKYFGAKEVVSE
jgi:preprotein translocase subunit SecD